MIINCCCFRFLIIRLHKREKRSKKLKKLYKRQEELKKQLEDIQGVKKVSFNP